MAQKEVNLEQESLRDPLTGAFNRPYIGVFLGREIILARKYNRDLGLLFVDVDNFKDINDHEPTGHAAGDRALKVLVEIMKKTGGDEAITGRWGGEEFLMVVPDTNSEKLKHLAVSLGTEIRKGLAGRAKLERGTVTASMGAVILGEEDDLTKFIGRGDAMMYKAKEAGRSGVVLESPDGQRETILIE
jgi:diguanylate cyclase (GGDEF)-like protein